MLKHSAFRSDGSSARDHVVTVGELARLVRCEPWQIRRLLQDVKPSISADNRRTRLYTIEDACFVRLALLLEQAGCSAWQRRAILANHLDDLRRAFADPAASLLLAVRGVRGKVLPASERSRLGAETITVSLSSIRRGLADAIARLRRDDPTVHQFNRRIPIRTALLDAPDVPAIW